jgi:Ca-activated chloride channel family protein
VNAGGLKIFVVMSLVSWLAPAARSESAQVSVGQGNTLYAQGNYNEAIDRYDQALLEEPEALEPKFNKANSYYRLDDLAEALDLYKEVAAKSKDMKLVAGAKYNLGNCYFQRGSKQKDSDLQKALADLTASVGSWRQVLDIEPENEKAAKNIEVARLIIKDIIDQLNKQRKQQQEQAAEQRQLQEKLKELLEDQKGLAERTRQTSDEVNKGAISPQQATDNYGRQAKEQEQLRDRTEQTLEEMRSQDPNNPQPPPMQQAANELEKAVENQTRAGERLNASAGVPAEQSQQRAIDHIENALKALSQGSEQNPQPQQAQQTQGQEGQENRGQEPNQPQDPNQSDQQQQEGASQQKVAAPDTAAEEILDKEQRQRKERQVLQRAGYQKVEKDW